MDETSCFECSRDDFERLSDREFHQRLWLNKHTFAGLLHVILPNMTPDIPINNGVSAKTKLQCGMRFLASGSLCRLNSDQSHFNYQLCSWWWQRCGYPPDELWWFFVVIQTNKIHNETRADVKNGSFGLLPPSRVTLAIFWKSFQGHGFL